MAQEITLAELKAMVPRLELPLADPELERLLPGVNHTYHQTRELRRLITDRTEPAAAFVAWQIENR